MTLLIPAAPSTVAPLEAWQRHVEALEPLLDSADSDIRAAAAFGLRVARRMVVVKSTPPAVESESDLHS